VQDTARISTIIERQHKKEAERKASGRDVDSLVQGDYINYNASSSKFKAAAKLIQVLMRPPQMMSFSSVTERVPRNDRIHLLERKAPRVPNTYESAV
jgi:hypothetical protein